MANFGSLTGGAGVDAPFVGTPAIAGSNTSRPALASAYRRVSAPGPLNVLGKDWGSAPGAIAVPTQLTGQVPRYAISSFVLRAPSDMPFLASGATALYFQGWDGTQWVPLWSGSSLGTPGETVTITGLSNTLYYGHQIVIAGDGTAAVGIAYLQMAAAGAGVLSPAPVMKPGIHVGRMQFLTLSSGSYLQTGSSISSRYTTPVRSTLSLAPAAYSVTGNSLSLLARTRVLPLTPQTYAWTGIAVSRALSRKMPLVGGAYTATGQPVWRARGAKVPLVSGTYSVSGQPVALTPHVVAHLTFSLAPAGYTLTSKPVSANFVSTVLTSWMAAVGAAGGTVSLGREILLANLVNGLMQDGVWALLDRLFIFAAENTQSALIDLVGSHQASLVLSPPFTTDRGYTTDGTNYIDTNYNFSTDAVNFTQTAAHMAVWNLTDGTNSSPACGGSGGAIEAIFPKYTDSSAYFRINDASASGAMAAISDARGFFLGTRSGTNVVGFQNGTNLGLLTSDFSQAPQNVHMAAYTRQLAAISAGGSMTSPQQSSFYNRLRTYMTAVGVP